MDEWLNLKGLTGEGVQKLVQVDRTDNPEAAQEGKQGAANVVVTSPDGPGPNDEDDYATQHSVPPGIR